MAFKLLFSQTTIVIVGRFLGVVVVDPEVVVDLAVIICVALCACGIPERLAIPAIERPVVLRQNGIFEPFIYYKNDHFTKTGSGQT